MDSHQTPEGSWARLSVPAHPVHKTKSNVDFSYFKRLENIKDSLKYGQEIILDNDEVSMNYHFFPLMMNHQAQPSCLTLEHHAGTETSTSRSIQLFHLQLGTVSYTF